MKTKRRLLSGLLALCMVLCLMPTAFAEDARAAAGTSADNPLVIPEEALLWNSQNGTVLKGVSADWYKENVTDQGVEFVALAIPAKTTEIASNSFGVYTYSSGTTEDGKRADQQNITGELVAADFSKAVNLTEIGSQAFIDAEKLAGVINLKNTKVTEIGGTAFGGTAITGAVLPNTLTSFGSMDGNMAVFRECDNLAFVGTREAVGDEIFLELPQSLAKIGEAAFSFSAKSPLYQKMKKDGLVVSIPAAVTTIKENAFDNAGCSKNIFALESAQSFEGANAQAFGDSGWPENKQTVLFPSFSDYKNADAAKKAAMETYAYLGYAVTIDFVYNGETIASQQKIYGSSVQYVKDGATWRLDENYALPKPQNVPEPAAGYYGGWELDGEELTAESTISVAAPADVLKATWKDFVSEPTIQYSINGQPVEEQDLYTVQCFDTIGVQVTHPLMKTESTDTANDTYVEFEYYWFDIKDGLTGERGQKTSEEKYFYREGAADNAPTTVSEIPMRTEEDSRHGYADYYRVQVMGKLVVNGVPQPGYYYKSLAPGISFGGPIELNKDATTNTSYNIMVEVNPAQFTVRFDTQGGSSVAEQKVEYDKLVTEPEAPTREGYTFAGWYKEAACQNQWNFDEDKMPAKDMTLYAKWNANAATVNHIPTISAEDKVLTVGDTFNPLDGVTAYDEEDGAITLTEANIIANDVDTQKAGTYSVTYKVTDSQGAFAVKTITVVVKEKAVTPNKPAQPENPNGGGTGIPQTGVNNTLDNPKTGDDSHLGLWFALMGIGAAGFSVSLYLQKRRRSVEK